MRCSLLNGCRSCSGRFQRRQRRLARGTALSGAPLSGIWSRRDALLPVSGTAFSPLNHRHHYHHHHGVEEQVGQTPPAAAIVAPLHPTPPLKLPYPPPPALPSPLFFRWWGAKDGGYWPTPLQLAFSPRRRLRNRRRCFLLLTPPGGRYPAVNIRASRKHTHCHLRTARPRPQTSDHSRIVMTLRLPYRTLDLPKARSFLCTAGCVRTETRCRGPRNGDDAARASLGRSREQLVPRSTGGGRTTKKSAGVKFRWCNSRDTYGAACWKRLTQSK